MQEWVFSCPKRELAEAKDQLWLTKYKTYKIQETEATSGEGTVVSKNSQPPQTQRWPLWNRHTRPIEWASEKGLFVPGHWREAGGSCGRCVLVAGGA